LAEQLAAGVSGVTSTHLSGKIASSTPGASGTIAADEKLSQGKVTAINLSEKIGGQSISLILIGTKAWAKLPTSTGPKPWLKVTTSSTNPTIRAVAASLARTSSDTSLGSLVGFARAANNITKVGREKVDGVTTTHYTMTVATAKLPAASGKTLSTLGVKSIPTQMWIDDKGRPVRVSEKVTASGVSTTTTLDLTKYNASVTVTPPPAGQIGG
jgi:LppX_LprAFG lipoprotein